MFDMTKQLSYEDLTTALAACCDLNSMDFAGLTLTGIDFSDLPAVRSRMLVLRIVLLRGRGFGCLFLTLPGLYIVLLIKPIFSFPALRERFLKILFLPIRNFLSIILRGLQRVNAVLMLRIYTVPVLFDARCIKHRSKIAI